MGLTALYNHFSGKKTTARTVAICVFLSLLISGLGGFITNPITDGVNSVINHLADKAESEYVENKYYELTHYNRGYYTGYILHGKPEGQGKMVYPNDDEHSYSMTIGDTVVKAIRYEGNFKDGWRDGQGKVIYEGGYREEGTYYGQWMANKIVFRGKIWYGDDYYLDAIIYSKSPTESWTDFKTTEWQRAE